jgi:hypothetical protein
MIAMMKLSELIAAQCRRPRFFAIAIALGAAAALAASAEAGTVDAEELPEVALRLRRVPRVQGS